jgi:hypothetical protein
MGFQAVPSEKVIKEAAANYKGGLVGGTLQLTTHRLFFESHKLNVQTGGVGIDLREIASVSPTWTKLAGLIPILPTSMTVTTKNGDVHKFVLGGRSDWIRAINEARNSHR